ncbi:hypothetical protein EVAR_59732_1 [Eumeta japonica]|uniref:Uncharacterized protein n=1 Tax=Eumeta variegata TaxID=151549 RepID=A0A4C1XJ16_EUMVA|nr:hypothetical protein EVAR_59732_1 [Eumeta japonica]
MTEDNISSVRLTIETDKRVTYQEFRISLGNESWVYWYDLETKKQSAQWMFPVEELRAKVKQGRSVGKKMMASFFGMTGQYATIVLEEKLREKWSMDAEEAVAAYEKAVKANPKCKKLYTIPPINVVADRSCDDTAVKNKISDMSSSDAGSFRLNFSQEPNIYRS